MHRQPPHRRRLRRLQRAAQAACWVGLATGCAVNDTPADRETRPRVEPVEQRVCLGRPLPMNHIDEIVPAPDGRLALVGRRTALAEPGPGVEIAAWVVAVLDPARPDAIEVIERTDPANRPTPIAWRGDTLWVSVDTQRMVPADDPAAAGIAPPFGVPPLLDPGVPHTRMADGNTFMILGEPSPRGSALRTFVEVERGDAEAGTVDRVVATYGTLQTQHLSFSISEDEEFLSRFIEAVGIVDWHIDAEGTLTVMGWAQSSIGLLNFWYAGSRHTVDADPEAGWFEDGALEASPGSAYVDMVPGRISYDLRGGSDGMAELVFYDPTGGPSTTPFWGGGFPSGRTVYDQPPPFATWVKITTVDTIGDDRLLAGSACIDRPNEDFLYDEYEEYPGYPGYSTPHCRAFVSRHVGESDETRWSVTVDDGDIDTVIDVRQIDGRLMAFAAAFDLPQGPGTSVTPARLVMLDHAGRCLVE